MMQTTLRDITSLDFRTTVMHSVILYIEFLKRSMNFELGLGKMVIMILLKAIIQIILLRIFYISIQIILEVSATCHTHYEVSRKKVKLHHIMTFT
jgi:hypothetical protein